ncbi:MAG: bifunctional folylpolyglutamate synthase/dihydrofolate synthase [Chitinophagaceae bacterium]|nr:bifunctional folylpolyglutamate synthase/dihydrofolate synthase [Chitinophagaceae bacterium]
MNYEETIAFLYTQLPMYSRIGKAAYKSDLINTQKLCALLDHPENGFRSIHIAGTNGKGSTSHMLAAMLQSNGYKTGLYTSPHLKDFRERIRINGVMIPEKEVVDFVNAYQEKVIEIGCSFFEWTVGLAFDYFRKEQVDIAVIETGLGGRLDSTNVITPLLSVITNVSYDHMDLLGETLQKIAVEKAGIIKHNIPVVIGEHSMETDAVFIKTAAEKSAPLSFAGDHWKVTGSKYNAQSLLMNIEGHHQQQWQIELDLMGAYQEKNILTALEAQRLLIEQGFILEMQKCVAALGMVKQLTGLSGRWEILSTAPLIIADVAHNEAGINHSIQQLKNYSFKNLHIVIGFVREKDIRKILSLFPDKAIYYFCKPDIPRGLETEALQAAAIEFGLNGISYASVAAAFEAAKKNASVEDIIYVGGSTFVVAEVI